MIGLMSAPLFTVGIPVVKTKYLVECLNSVLAQSFQDYEIIVFNDASPEPVKEILPVSKKSKIRYYETETNLGKKFPTRTWNKVLHLAKGKYFLLLGDDDTLSPNFLAEMATLINKYPKTNLFRGQLIVSDKNNKTIYYGLKPLEYETWEDQVYYRFKYIRPQATCEHVAKTEVLKKIGGFLELPLAWGSDDAAWIRLAYHGGIASTTKAYACWRNSPYNISSLSFTEEKEQAIKKLCKFVTKFVKQHKCTVFPKKILLDAVNDREKSHIYNARSQLVNYF